MTTENQNLLYAHILLDRSGSMEAVRDTTIDAVNEYAHGLATDANTDAAVSLTLFDQYPDTVALETVFDGVKAADAPKLTRETYAPRGTTPLNDAIGKTVAKMKSEWHRPNERIALVIVTDGMENASTEFDTKAVKALIEAVQKEGWLVIYLGANQDAFAEGSKRGTAQAHALAYKTSNMSATMQAAARVSLDYAETADAGGVAFSVEERHAAMSVSESDDARAKRKRGAKPEAA